MTLIKITEKNPEILITLTKTNVLQMITSHDYLIYENQVPDKDIDQLADEVTEQAIAFAQAKFLRKLDFKHPGIDVSFEFIPIQVEHRGQGVVEKERIPVQNQLASDHLMEFREGDYFKLRMINHSRRKAYVCMLDIQPDNIINAMIPYGNRTPEEYFVPAQAAVELDDIFVVGKPYGLESLKLIATEEPIDLSRLVTSRGTKQGNNTQETPLETLLKSTYQYNKNKQRGSQTASIPPAAGSITTQIFRIVPREK